MVNERNGRSLGAGRAPTRRRATIAVVAGLLAAGSWASKSFEGVPFELDRNVILVPVRIGEHGPYLAMIDTGTDPSGIDVSLAKELGLKLGASGEIDGAGTESVQAAETVLPEITVGPVVAKNVAALAGPSIAKIAEALGRPVRVILGKSFLDHRIVRWDFPNRVLRFPRALARPEPTADRAVLPCRYEDDVLLTGVRIDGKPVRAILDTGSNGAVKVTPEATRSLGLEEKAAAATTSESTGFRGSYSTRVGRIESLELGTLRLGATAATFWSRGTGHDGKPWDVNVGNAVLKDFVVTLDSVDGILVVERPK
jgi:predicted aspartyl protease